MTIRSVLLGTGSALPKRAVSNADMTKMVDTTDEWIVERTGIRNRYIADDTETTGTLATAAAQRALAASDPFAEAGLFATVTVDRFLDVTGGKPAFGTPAA